MPVPEEPDTQPPAPWWKHAVIYQIYPRSWADSTGDGDGDLRGIARRLPHLRTLGVDAVWLSPFYTSPQADNGYDVADHRDVDPRHGTLADFDLMLGTAHGLGLKVIIDLVPNHSSDEHPWFQEALAAGPGSRARRRYIFRDGRGPAGEEPPNDWLSIFGGPAWTRVTEADGSPGQWYLHLFLRKQPDFDWSNPEVADEFEDVIRFWLDRGVDGFRIDVAHGMIKAPGLPDYDVTAHYSDHTLRPGTPRPPMWDQPPVHDIHRRWRRITDGYGEPARILCAEAYVKPVGRAMEYVRPDELHQAFNFDILQAYWDAADLRSVIDSSIAAAEAVGAPVTWVLSNHDEVRHASRYGLPSGSGRLPNGVGPDDPQPDRPAGLRRARAATTLVLGLPGSVYLYQGEELGLPESTLMEHSARRDPTYERSGGRELGRDGCRVPMPWEKDAPSFGFGPTDATWLPQPPYYGEYAVDQQDGVEGSTLELYRELLRLRRELALGTGTSRAAEGFPADVLAYTVRPDREILVLANLGPRPVALPPHARVLVSSGPLTEAGEVPTDTAVWAVLGSSPSPGEEPAGR
ncbi:glycoside hydrolase family 13 protein [Streptomyces sp. NPDC007325]|uniref:glycoside hydrolase family 13 protein n=1 Tax=Streptomyces sp. NPDC007325 TaxID=3154588 RepID=UPI0033D1EBE1